MYEDQTREVIERRTMDRIDPKFDPREGSIIQTNLASAAIELAKLYEALDYIDAQRSPMTADSSHLDQWGTTFSINRLDATYAILKAEIIMKEGYECPLGSRFSQNELNFVVITHNEGTEYSVQCEQAGEIGNAAYGRIIPILNIPGLLSARITGTEIPGTDVESDDSLRERLINNFRNQSYGWNMATYRQEIAKIQGVGGFKVIRYFEEKDFWVGIYLIDSKYQKPTEETIKLVQNTLLPLLPDYTEPTIQNSGDGLVAIGHVPIVMAADEATIDIHLNITLSPKYTYGQLESKITEKIQAYLTGLNKEWDDLDAIVVRVSGIERAVLDIDGVLDVFDTEINGFKGNVELGEFEVTKLGTITHTENSRADLFKPKTVKLSDIRAHDIGR